MSDGSEGLSRRGLLGLGLGRLRPAYLDRLAAIDAPIRADHERPPRRADLWEGVDYRPLGNALAPAAIELAGFCDHGAGTRVLDAGARDGDLAIELARGGADVVACEPSAALAQTGRARARGAGLEVEWRVACATRLPFDDASFDCVASAFGATYAGDVRATAAELFRVVRPGGLVAITAWSTAGLMGEVIRLLSRYNVYDGAVRPSAWGRYETIYREFMLHTDEFDAIDRELTVASSPAALWDLLARSYAPLVSYLRSAPPEAATRLRGDVETTGRIYAAERREAPGLPAAYVIDYGRRPV